jgi:hypothetical protein
MENVKANYKVNLPATLEQKELFKETIREKILEGKLNPLEFYRQAKIIVESVEELKKDSQIFECASTEIAKYGKEKPTINGAVVTPGSKSTYDYESTGDPVWKELKEKIQEREKFLKAIPSGGTVDPDTGLLLQPPTVKVSEFITVKL